MTGVRVLTPAGRGAIAVVEVVGPDAVGMVDRWFAGLRPLAAAPIDAVRYGRWRRDDDAAPGEDVVAVHTAADRVEVHCHGGLAASAAIVASLVDGGATELSAPLPATLRESATQALASAVTERAAGVLLDQANGALEQALRDALASLDAGDLASAAERLDELLSRERLGRRLTAPWRVVVAGPPNVGKSRLVNALLGYERAIVYDRPGTTRDVVTAAAAIAGWPVTLADTAGVRPTDDPLEAAGVELARQTLRVADIVVVVAEAATYATPESEASRCDLLAEAAKGVGVVSIASKVDLAPGFTPPEGVVATDAPHGLGVAETLAAIERAMAVGDPPAGTAVLFLPEHGAALRAARQALRGDGAPGARPALLALLAGEKP